MDAFDRETLRRIEQNDNTVTKLTFGHTHNAIGIDHLSRLGASIGVNMHLQELEFDLSRCTSITEVDFFNGLKCNSSICKLILRCHGSRNLVDGGVGPELLRAYQENNSHLTHLRLSHIGLQNGGDVAVNITLRNCTNLRLIMLTCDINDEQLLPMIEAVRGHRSLEELHLGYNRIGNTGCSSLATLLTDPNTNLLELNLYNNRIGNEGAIILYNSLANNTRLKTLDLQNNPIQGPIEIHFSKALCNLSSINATFSSNHTLSALYLPHQYQLSSNLTNLLSMSTNTNKSHVAIRKILKYHPIIDMEPFFEWGAEEDGEHTLKALPHVINWFERAEEAVADEDDISTYPQGPRYHVELKKLLAIFQFTKAMPILFVPAPQSKGEDKKRKRDDKNKGKGGKRHVSMSSAGLLSICLMAVTIVDIAAAEEVLNNSQHPSRTCRTRFTFSRPTNDNVSSILFGRSSSKVQQQNADSSAVSFNHDSVGITQPIQTTGDDMFPQCIGYSKIKDEAFRKQVKNSGVDAVTIYTGKTRDYWRVLRFHKQVGHGKSCYNRVKDAVLNWDFVACKGSMGIISAAIEQTAIVPRRNLLATFTELYIPRPFRSLFVVNPVHVVYEMKDNKDQNKCKFSSTAYATLSGHLLSGEERVTVRIGKGGEVAVEIISFSRPAPSFGGKVIWPLIGGMQREFFLAELNHLDKVAKCEVES